MKELEKIAEQLKWRILHAIEYRAGLVETPDIKYKEQYILEELIKKLQERV